MSHVIRRCLPVAAAAAGFLVFAAAAPLLDRGSATAAERYDGSCNLEASRGEAPPLIVTGFATDSAAVPRDRESEIAAYAGQLRHAAKICVVGQADKRGASEYNDRLAMKRARAVAARLIKAGVDPATLSLSSRAEAFGDTAPKWMWLSASRSVVVHEAR